MAKKLFDRSIGTPLSDDRFAYGKGNKPAENITRDGLIALVVKNAGVKNSLDWYYYSDTAEGTLEPDEDWHSLNIAEKTYTGVTWVLLRVLVASGGTAENYISLKEDGTPDANYNNSTVSIGDSGVARGDCWVKVTGDYINYKMSPNNKITTITIGGYI